MTRPSFAILALAVLICGPAMPPLTMSAAAGAAQIDRQAGKLDGSNDDARATANPAHGVSSAGAARLRMAQGRAPASPSFSCRGRLNRTELRICENATLADLDRKIASIYSWLRGRLSPSEKRVLRNDQRQWLRQRDRCGGNDACIERELYERMAYLNEYQ